MSQTTDSKPYLVDNTAKVTILGKGGEVDFDFTDKTCDRTVLYGAEGSASFI